MFSWECQTIVTSKRISAHNAARSVNSARSTSPPRAAPLRFVGLEDRDVLGEDVQLAVVTHHRNGFFYYHVTVGVHHRDGLVGGDDMTLAVRGNEHVVNHHAAVIISTGGLELHQFNFVLVTGHVIYFAHRELLARRAMRSGPHHCR